MPRFYLPPGAWTADAALTGDEARHLSQVLRSRSGEIITVFDGEGRRAEAEVLAIARDRVSLKLGESVSTPTIKPFITLAQAIPKGKNMDLIVQKAVELGVSAIQPLITHNTIVQPGEGKSDKWRRTALEACKQCGQDSLPQIAEPLTYQEWLSTRVTNGLDLIASLTPHSQPLKKLLREKSFETQITILIGPEGDFTAGETYLALDKGFTPISLGKIVLRVETAALFCLSAARYEFS